VFLADRSKRTGAFAEWKHALEQVEAARKEFRGAARRDLGLER
jgi:hypothetical protein